jgi:hypothetical protein
MTMYGELKRRGSGRGQFQSIGSCMEILRNTTNNLIAQGRVQTGYHNPVSPFGALHDETRDSRLCRQAFVCCMRQIVTAIKSHVRRVGKNKKHAV